MTCVEFTAAVDPFVDGELDGDTARAMASHIVGCERCATLVAHTRALSAAVRGELPALAAPEALRARIHAAIRAPEAAPDAALQAAPRAVPSIAPPMSRRVWPARRWLAAAAVILVVGGASWRLGVDHGVGIAGGGMDIALRDAVVASHLRSLQGDHLVDVPSSDRHTVKPWFNGRLDFSPPVADLVAQGFPLIGGRLDYLDGHPVAALVYGRARHIINVFVWPVAGGQALDAAPSTMRGYHLRHWTRDGMAFWAVSDVADADLDAFVSLLRGTDVPPPAVSKGGRDS
jgi:anti-sigma factor RsiW